MSYDCVGGGVGLPRQVMQKVGTTMSKLFGKGFAHVSSAMLSML